MQKRLIKPLEKLYRVNIKTFATTSGINRFPAGLTILVESHLLDCEEIALAIGIAEKSCKVVRRWISSFARNDEYPVPFTQWENALSVGRPLSSVGRGRRVQRVTIHHCICVGPHLDQCVALLSNSCTVGVRVFRCYLE